jgi:hypothetical protein
MALKRYWNDPTERLEEHHKFVIGTFMEYFLKHGWENMLKSMLYVICFMLYVCTNFNYS